MQKYCLSRPIKNKQGNRSIIGIGKSDWPGADYTKEPWGQSKCFANGYDGRGVNMRRWICWDGVNIGQWIWWKRGKGQSKCSARVDTVIVSCSWLAIYCHTRQLFESLVSLKITFPLDKGLKWQAADVRTTSLWLNWLCRCWLLLCFEILTLIMMWGAQNRINLRY